MENWWPDIDFSLIHLFGMMRSTMIIYNSDAQNRFIDGTNFDPKIHIDSTRFPSVE